MKRQRKRSTSSLPRKVDITMCLLTLLIFREYYRNDDHDDQSAPTVERLIKSGRPYDDFMSTCLSEVLDYIPLGLGSDKTRRANPYNTSLVMPTHLEADNGRWNPELFLNTKVAAGDCWMMGASLHIDATEKFLQTNKDCKLHAFEPIPLYAKNGDIAKAAVVHEYGLGFKSDTFQMLDVKINDAETSSYWYSQEIKKFGRNGGAGGRIEPFSKALEDAGGSYPSALILYCQGCEQMVLPDAHQADLLKHISTILFVAHQYPSYRFAFPSNKVWEYCEVQYLLQQTHVKTGGIAYGWERWELKQKSRI